MATTTALSNESTDIADLWGDALSDYYKTTGQDLKTLPRFTSVSDIMDDAQLKNDLFDAFRHDKGKVDKLRSAVSRNSDLVMKGAEYIAQAATPAFPPSAAILTAFTYVMKACKDVSADYDKITSFFDEMNNFLERVSIIESRMPSVPAYKLFLTRVFASMMNLLAIATKAVKKGRFKKWFKTLLEGGGDDELSGGYSLMETALKRLESATNFATLGNTEDIKKDTKSIVVTTQRVDVSTQRIDLTTQDIQVSVKEGFLQVTELQTQLAENFAKMVENQRKEAAKRAVLPQPHIKDPGARKHAAFSLVQRSFVRLTITTEQAREIESSFVHGTAEWIFDEEPYEIWISGEKSILFILGGPGVGKSNIAFSIAQKLQAKADYESRTSVAYFYFKDEHEDLRYLSKATTSIIRQLAEQDTVYCEQVAAEISKLGDESLDITDWLSLWNTFLLSKFPKDAEGHAYLIFDGLDEAASSPEKKLFLEVLQKLSAENSNIHVVVTFRPIPEYDPHNLMLSYAELSITKEKISVDFIKLIDARMDRVKGLSKLGRFRRPVKRRITSELQQKADGMLFVEHMLRRYNIIGREGAVLKDMANFCPTDLSSLYDLMLLECQGRRSTEQYQTLKKLFAWLAFSRRPLTLNEASGLVNLTGQDSSFSIEEELEGKSARILELMTPLGADDESDMSSGEDAKKDEKISGDDGAFPLRFQERSLREYFQAMSVDDDGLRTSPSAAHLTIFENAVSVICGVSSNTTFLSEYSSKYWASHFMDIDRTAISEKDSIRVVKSLALILTNTKDASKLIEIHSSKYTDILGDAPKSSLQKNEFLDRIQEWVARVRLDGTSLNEPALSWVREVKGFPSKTMVCLGKGHVKNWFSGPYANVMTNSFEFALNALALTDLLPIVTPKQRSHPSPELIVSVASLFKDIPKNTQAYRSIALVLDNYEHSEASIEWFQKSLEVASTDLSRFYNYVSIAKSHMDLAEGNEEEDDDQPHVTAALENINSALKIEFHPDSDKIRNDIASQTRVALLSRAKCEQRLKNVEAAVTSYEQAKLTNSTFTMNGEDMNNWAKLLTDERLLETLTTWTLWDRMSWLTYTDYDCDEDEVDKDDKPAPIDPNFRFQKAAKTHNKLQFMVETYEQIIAYQIRLKRASYPRLQLAHAYRHVIWDKTKAKEVLYDILDSDSCLDAYGDEDIETVLSTRYDISDIIYEEFRASSDPKDKEALLAEFKKLPERRLARNVSVFGIYDSATAILAAKMTRVVGTKVEFQAILQRTFDSCIEGLTDAEGWNDSGSLRLLAKALVCVGLNIEAQIALSAQFSIIDPTVSHESDYSGSESGEDEDEDEDEDENDSEDEIDDNNNGNEKSGSTNDNPVEEKETEDIAPDSYLTCDGECDNPDHESWKEGAVYSCLVCTDCDLCEPCYQIRKSRNNGEPNTYWRGYCGKNHQYIRAPIEGWKGVKDGVMTIGDKKTVFAEWLKDLKDKKWKEAWRNFWLNEELQDDIL